MKICIDRGSLVHALEAVVGVAEGKALSPSSAVLIEATEGMLTLTTTDNESSARIVEPVEVLNAGRALLPAKKLLDIVKSLPDGPVELVMDGVWGTIAAGAARFKIVGLDPGQFPDVPEPDMSADIEVDVDLLRGVIRRTLYAVGEKHGRFVLHGLYLEMKDGALTAVATDGHRMVVEEWPGVVPEGCGVVRDRTAKGRAATLTTSGRDRPGAYGRDVWAHVPCVGGRVSDHVAVD